MSTLSVAISPTKLPLLDISISVIINLLIHRHGQSVSEREMRLIMPLATNLPFERERSLPTRIIRVTAMGAHIQFRCANELLEGSIGPSETLLSPDGKWVIRQVLVEPMQRWFDPKTRIYITHIAIDGKSYEVYEA